jgi:phosphatidate cytidylyltransferase
MSATDAPAPAAPSKGRVFLRRLVSFSILWFAVIGALFFSGRAVSNTFFLVIMAALAGLGLVEFYSMAARRGLPCFPRWGVVGGVALMVCTFFKVADAPGALRPVMGDANDFETAFVVLFVLGMCVLRFRMATDAPGLTAMAVTLLGLMYVPWLLNFVAKINFYPGIGAQAGHFYLLFFILVTKFSDTGAYCTGSLIGRHKMCPSISPGKTWEGFVGAVATSVGVSLLFAHLAGPRLPGMTLIHAAALGALLGVAAVVGDLVESLFKRETGVKDSGRWFPGVGGVLDVLDSLLFNAPLMYFYMRWVMHPEAAVSASPF